MMKFKLVIVLILLVPIIAYTQTDSLVKKNNFFLRASTGANISRFKDDVLKFNSEIKPFFGLSFYSNLSERLSLKASTLFSYRGSGTLDLSKRIENQYLDLVICPRIELIPKLYFQTGFVYSSIIASNEVICDGEEWKGLGRKSINGYNSEMNLFAGIEFSLQENVNFEINCNIPTKKNNTSNIQLGINIALNNRTEKPTSYRKTKVNASKSQISQLKKGVLLVRLNTSENSIKALQEIGKNEKAEKLKKSQERENKKIIKAFKNNFDFCKVRFFYSYDSYKVKNRQFEGIFLNDSLQVTDSIKVDTNVTFFIADFSSIEQDTMKYFSEYSYEPVEKKGLKKTANYYSASTDIDVYGLRILDHNFVQLNKPFPYFTRAVFKTIKKHPEQFIVILTIYNVFLPLSYDKTVSKMNNKLDLYYIRTVYNNQK